MKALLIISGLAALLLGSATPAPPPAPAAVHLAQQAQHQARPFYPRLVYEPEPPPAPPPLPAPDPAPPPAEPALAAEAPSQSGGVKILVSLPQQKAYVFEDGELIATSPVSTGKKGHETPTGTFPILQKKVHHRSNRYSNAPMPYMQRLTWQGVALHAGSLPGYPASHGCIRLPHSFAKKLYDMTDHGTRVTVTKKRFKSAKDALSVA